MTKYNCFFLDEEREMTAHWYVCTYNKNTDANYWQKGPYCEKHEDCPYYCSKDHAFNIIHGIMNVAEYLAKGCNKSIEDK